MADAGFTRVGAPGLATTGVSRLKLPWRGELTCPQCQLSVYLTE